MDEQPIALLLAVVNLTVCCLALWASIRRASFCTFVWFLAAAFGAATIFDVAVAPVLVNFGIGVKAIYPSTMANSIMFMLFFNASMAAAQQVPHRLVSAPSNREYLFLPQTYPPVLFSVANFLTILLTITSFLYLKRASAYTVYWERYWDQDPKWEMVLMVASWSVVTMALIQGRKVLTWYLLLVGLIITYVTKVRAFALFFVIPILLYHIMRSVATSGKAPRALFGQQTQKVLRFAAGLLCFAVFAVYLWQTRSPDTEARSDQVSSVQSYDIPELSLTKGFYAVVDVYSAGAPKFGFKSFERLFAGFLFPYLNYFTDYTYPLDPPVEFARLLGGYPLESGRHFPFLIYAEAYASFGFIGCLAGVFWGLLYGFVDLLLTKPAVFVFFFPYATWFIYETFRGAVSNSILSIPREFYINVLLMTICWIQFSRLGERHRMIAPAPNDHTRISQGL